MQETHASRNPPLSEGIVGVGVYIIIAHASGSVLRASGSARCDNTSSTGRSYEQVDRSAMAYYGGSLCGMPVLALAVKPCRNS